MNTSSKKPCRFFQTPQGCHWGQECYFSHSKDAKPVQKAACRFFASAEGCRFGSRCYFRHDGKGKSTNQCPEVPTEAAEPEDPPKSDEVDELVVFGFLRPLMAEQAKGLESADSQFEIDSAAKSAISLCCQSFYAPIIRWSESPEWHNADRMQIAASGNCIAMKARGWGSAFLTGEYSTGLHHFKFKFDHLDSRRKYYVLLGIWRTGSGPPILDGFFTDKKYNGHAINAIDGTLTNPNLPGCGGTKYATYCKQGDVVDMYCDFDQRRLTYAINGKYYDEAQSIHVEEEGESFKVAITMYWETDCIRFVSHDQKAFAEQ